MRVGVGVGVGHSPDGVHHSARSAEDTPRHSYPTPSSFKGVFLKDNFLLTYLLFL